MKNEHTEDEGLSLNQIKEYRSLKILLHKHFGSPDCDYIEYISSLLES